MSDTSEMWAAHKQASATRRASNREASARMLQAASIVYVTYNNGVHLIVEGKGCKIDFWPGTGKWISREGTKGRGVRNLIAHIRG